MNYHAPTVVAEIGCNHKGSLEIAKELIGLAKECKANYVKFQKRNPSELLTEKQYASPHPNPMHAYGDSYGEHRDNLEFDIDQHKELKIYCDKKDIGYSSSVWDITSVKEIIGLNPDFIKVPSACNNQIEMLKILRDDYRGEVHISMGMTTHEEENKIVKLFEDKKVAKSRLVIYACTSGYPVPFEDVCLLEIHRLIKAYEGRVKLVGFSGHHLGIAVDVSAYTLGAQWIERHFTKDRTWKGTDHAASLEPTGMRKLIRDLHAVYKALQHKQEEILKIEEVQRDKLKFHSS